ncbi:hypothetical protein ACE1OC_40990 [Streptomyces sp. DSM 116496]|uniref:hypothetical protein n=1 Tax=Streptomyces stoeckheimensis TaxID=3344656 RepID=UPI0038B29E17
MRRWSLPLLLVTLLAGPGWVTVHPAPGSASKASPTVVADQKHPGPGLPEQRAAAPAALPLSPLPGTHSSGLRADPAQRVPGPAHEAPAAAADRRSPSTPRPARQQPPRPHRATTPKTGAHPTARSKRESTGSAKAGGRTPAPRRTGRPAPGVRAGDMAALCRSAHGVNSPAITALCQDTYGR